MRPPPAWVLVEEAVLVVVQVGEVILGAAVAAQRSAVGELLQVVQACRDAAVPVRVERIQGDRSAADDAGVQLTALKDRLPVGVHYARLGGAVGVDVPAALVGVVALLVAVAQRQLQVLQRGDGLAGAAQLALAFLVGGPDGGLDLVVGHGVALRDDQRDAVLRGAAAQGNLGLVDVQVAEDGLRSGDNLARVLNNSLTHNDLILLKIVRGGFVLRALV